MDKDRDTGPNLPKLQQPQTVDEQGLIPSPEPDHDQVSQPTTFPTKHFGSQYTPSDGLKTKTSNHKSVEVIPKSPTDTILHFLVQQNCNIYLKFQLTRISHCI